PSRRMQAAAGTAARRAGGVGVSHPLRGWCRDDDETCVTMRDACPPPEPDMRRSRDFTVVLRCTRQHAPLMSPVEIPMKAFHGIAIATLALAAAPLAQAQTYGPRDEGRRFDDGSRVECEEVEVRRADRDPNKIAGTAAGAV